MRYAIVSTYPREGSRNIGDKLIETATAGAIRAYDPAAQIDTIWRADDWENVRGVVTGADHVVFACLAIRSGIAGTYTYLPEILDLGVPVSAISAGTSLRLNSADILKQGFSDDDIALLRRLADRAKVFTTRGALTQAFCEAHRLAGAQLTGDVAFIDPRFDGRRFEPRERIGRIVVSDPHDAENFAGVFRRLTMVLRQIFPQAQIDCALHGTNPTIERLAGKLDLTVRPLHEDPEHGLDAYDEYDLHAGFRVHGHVSALTRRIPSYLLEQDGRGADYGLTLERKFSVSCTRFARPQGTRTAQILRLIRGQPITRPYVPASAADMLGALVAKDAAKHFESFAGFETTLAGFQARTGAAIRRICQPDTG